MSPERIYGEGEVLPPRAGVDALTDENLDHLAGVLDDIFRVPGTRLRFGLDAVVGLVPGIGDMLTSLASCLIIFAAWKRGLPRVTIARMVANVAVDGIVGSMPIVGDLFDVAWKANRMNMRLLKRDQGIVVHRQTWRDWLFLGLIGLVLLGLALLPFVVLYAIVWMLRR